MKTKIEKAMGIYERFSHMPSARVKEKIESQCDMTPESASSYYYVCKAKSTKKKTKKKAARR